MTRRATNRVVQRNPPRTAASQASLHLHFSRRELATIQAALRFHLEENLQGETTIPDKAVKRIATQGGRLQALDAREVTALSERLGEILRRRRGGSPDRSA